MFFRRAKKDDAAHAANAMGAAPAAIVASAEGASAVQVSSPVSAPIVKLRAVPQLTGNPDDLENEAAADFELAKDEQAIPGDLGEIGRAHV